MNRRSASAERVKHHVARVTACAQYDPIEQARVVFAWGSPYLSLCEPERERMIMSKQSWTCVLPSIRQDTVFVAVRSCPRIV